jgi:uncharacterized membrane protein
LLLALFVIGQAPPGRVALTQEAPVRAVLFYSPTCPHCEQVITAVLPAILDRYGGAPRVWSIVGPERPDPVLHLVANSQLEILLVDASWSAGQQLYRASIQEYALPEDREGVPQLVIGDTVLVGSEEIPLRLPMLIQHGLDRGGTPWPRVTGLDQLIAVVSREVGALALDDSEKDQEVEERIASDTGGGAPAEMAEAQGDAAAQDLATVGQPEAEVERPTPGEEPTPVADEKVDEPFEPAPDHWPGSRGAETQPAEAHPGTEVSITDAIEGRALATPSRLETIELGGVTLAQRLSQDPVGNSIAVAVLVVMLVSTLSIWRWAGVVSPTRPPGIYIPILSVVGIGVASYLSYVEIQGVMAVCGPVGDCNTVQQSEYARVLGVLPVGVLGLAGYVAIFTAWFVSRARSGRLALLAKLGLLVMAVIGTLFSIYLTFLEPFVLGATCACCLASAVIITSVMWLSARPGRDAWRRLRTPGPARTP